MPDPVLPVTDIVDAKILLGVLAQVHEGDFTARMPLDWTGVAGKIADGLNDVIIANEVLGTELARVSELVGKQGKLSQRVVLGGATQSWSGSIESVNSLIDDLVRPTIEMQRVIGAVADGDLSKKVSADVRGEMLELKNTINAMVDQLNGFISEVTRVTREVGTEGKLGQAAAVTIEVGGVWKDLTDNVNEMAANLTGQVRNIAEVTTAVANGDLTKKISIDVKGEFLELKNTVNAMVDQLNAFAGEVTRVAREVGVEGKLGGQAKTKEIGGVWKDLTDNVNQLAANLTNQVRAIANVATAVIEGDLTRQVAMEASGEVEALKVTLNEMIRNLRETTRQNVEQDWLKTSRERFTRMLQRQDDLAVVSSMILSELAELVSAQHAVFYSMVPGHDGGEPMLEFQAGYGYEERKHLSTSFRIGEGLVGQCAKEQKRILLTDVPDDYVKISSGLGESPPLNIIVLPVLFEGSLRAVIELASFSPFSATHQAFLDSITESVGIVLSTIEAAAITERLLKQSQSQGEELRAQQQELRESNEDLGRQAKLLADQNLVAEQKNQEVEESKRLVEEKVSQLAVSSKYKSEFIANMSHELRTPLNSLLILAEQLEDNPDKNMTAKQVEYAAVIRSSGKDLLELLNSILDLAKVESGTATVQLGDVSSGELADALRREFEPVASEKGLAYAVVVTPDCPQSIVSDVHRLRQILKNLLANAFKFTERGSVELEIGLATNGWSLGNEGLDNAPSVIALAVSDTGIGINDEQQHRIFEAFAQGDGSTARLYGGTGLGLSISRELVGLLGGQITLTSVPGEGSTFTVYLPTGAPASVVPPAAPPVPVAAIDEPAAERARPGSRGRPARRAPGPRRRRRHPQHLRDDGLARTRPGRRDDRRERRRRASGSQRRLRIRRCPDGHHDAGDGRLRDDSRDSGDQPVRRASDHRDHRQGGRRRAPAVPRRRRQRLRPEAGRQGRAARGAPALAAGGRCGTVALARRGSRTVARLTRAPGADALRSRRGSEPDRRHEDPRRRRRFPQHLCDDRTARARAGRSRRRRERRPGTRNARGDRGHRRRSDGHHDAGHGRVRGDRRDPCERAVRGAPDYRRHRQGGRRRAPALPGRGRQRVRSEACGHGPAACGSAAVATGDRGVRMNVALRLAVEHAETLAAKPPSQIAVLVVDDNAAKRLATVTLLKPLGYTIVEADSGAAALRCVLRQDFAVILLDVRMPIMDGFETAALIRQRPQSEMTPLIFITSYAKDESVHPNLYAAGAVDFIFAPLAAGELQAKVSAFANLFTRAEELAARAREVRASADELKLLTETAPIGIFRTDADDRYVYTNARWNEIMGLSTEEAIGRQWDTIAAPDDRLRFVTTLTDDPIAAGQQWKRFEFPLPGPIDRIVLVTAKPVLDVAGEVTGWVGTLADVTDTAHEHEADEARHLAEEKYRRIVETTTDGIWVIDAENRTTFVNQAMAEMLRTSVEEMVGHPIDDFYDNVEGPVIDASIAAPARWSERGDRCPPPEARRHRAARRDEHEPDLRRERHVRRVARDRARSRRAPGAG